MCLTGYFPPLRAKLLAPFTDARRCSADPYYLFPVILLSLSERSLSLTSLSLVSRHRLSCASSSSPLCLVIFRLSCVSSSTTFSSPPSLVIAVFSLSPRNSADQRMVLGSVLETIPYCSTVSPYRTGRVFSPPRTLATRPPSLVCFATHHAPPCSFRLSPAIERLPHCSFVHSKCPPCPHLLRSRLIFGLLPWFPSFSLVLRICRW